MSYTVEEYKLDEYSKGFLSGVRSFRGMLRLMSKEIASGADPLERIAEAQRWLNYCQQSCVGPFYTQEDFDKGETIPRDPPNFD